MTQELNLGKLNGHAVGRILKETVRRAMVIIRSERFIFEATGKAGYGGEMNDVFTSADTKAQEVYLRTFSECFPGFGVLAEENGHYVECGEGITAYFTVDPLDGTKAFVRKQSHGVATMVALVDNGEIISAYIGDVTSDEVYGYRPDSEHVFRISRLDSFEEMTYHTPFVPKESYVLLRDPPEKYDRNSQQHIKNAFGSYLVDGSSIGTWMARLWKREVAAVLIPGGGYETPWDSTPVKGICDKLGYLFYKPIPGGGGWQRHEPRPYTGITQRHYDLLVVHKNDCSLVLDARTR